MKKWNRIYHTISSDGKTEHITETLSLEFPIGGWNRNTERIVCEIRYHDRKTPHTYNIDKERTYTLPPQKSCHIKFLYFQSIPETTLYSSDKGDRRIAYDDFTIELCREKAEKILKDRLQQLYLQL